MLLPTSRQRLIELCNKAQFDHMDSELQRMLQGFPYMLDTERMTDDFVLGIQEFTTIITQLFYQCNEHKLAKVTCLYGCCILYIWWKHNIGSEFTEKEIEV